MGRASQAEGTTFPKALKKEGAQYSHCSGLFLKWTAKYCPEKITCMFNSTVWKCPFQGTHSSIILKFSIPLFIIQQAKNLVSPFNAQALITSEARHFNIYFLSTCVSSVRFFLPVFLSGFSVFWSICISSLSICISSFYLSIKIKLFIWQICYKRMSQCVFSSFLISL